jgi:outer membrane receptor for ferrienterochelin and colicin
MNFKILPLIVSTITIQSISAQQADTLKTVHLEEVTVSAFRVKSNMKELPQNIQVLNRRDIRQIPNESVSDLLKKTAGIDIVEYPGFSSNIGMRGFAPTAHGSTYTLTLVNGIPTGTQNPSTIDLNNTEQVEILKGPYSSFFGSGAMAGVINIVTPQNKEKLTGNFGISAGSFATYALKASIGGELVSRLNFDLSFKAFQQKDDYKTGNNNFLRTTSEEKAILDDTYGKTFHNTSYNKYNADLRLGYDINRDWQVNLYENIFIADKVLANGNFWGIYGSNQKGINRWSQSLSVEGKKGNHNLRFTPYFNNEGVDYYNNISDTNYVESSYIFRSYGFVLQDGFTFGNHRLIVGFDNHSQMYINKQWSKASERTAPYQPDYANIANGAFVQSTFNFFDSRLNASLGLRYDLIYFKLYETDYIESKNSTEKYQTVNPNVSLKYNILKGLSIHAGVGTAFLTPDAFKKTGNYTSGTTVYRGNPDLDPETSLSYDLGVSYANSSKGIAASIAWFDTDHDGLLVYDRSNKEYTTFKNADDAHMSGLEIALAYDFGSLSNYEYSLKLYGNLTHLLKSEVTTGGVTSDMKYVRKNNGSFGIEYGNNSNIALRLNGRYIGHRYEDNWLYGYGSNGNVPLTTADGTPIRPSLVNTYILEHPDFVVFDLTGSYTLAKRYTLGLSVQNLLDENYTEKDTYNMPGRMITGSLTYSF